ncbi:rod shape-determining protein MreD [Nitriliruptoraceae bacterium ZYF776]|nr:rod shape-determining protein MreD [Profundirhabdus halotolerans]
MTLRPLVVVLLVITTAAIQSVLFPHLAVGGYRPDLLLLVTVGFALRDGPLTGTRVGVAAGLVADLMATQTPLGLGVLIHACVGAGIGLLRPYLSSDSLTAPLVSASTTGFLATAAFGFGARAFGDTLLSTVTVLETALVVGVYNTVLALPAIGLVTRLTRRWPPGQTSATIG